MTLRIIALLATYNERRFIAACLEHYISQGVDVYLIDNESIDETVAIAERYRGKGLIDIETFPRNGMVRWHALMKRKQELAFSLEGDWFMHVDADEFRFSASGRTLKEGITELDAAEYNAINFLEYTFLPTREEPDHDHLQFQKTMRWYYSFLPYFPHRLNAWKRQPEEVNLASSAGHLVKFPGLRMAPESFSMRHYQCLSVPHVIEKYTERHYEPADLARGWHAWRSRFDETRITLPAASEMKVYESDRSLDPSNPRKKHIASQWALQPSG